MVNGEISHDKITRFMSEREYSSKDLWLEAKSAMRQIESGDGVLIFDDTISEKMWTDENEIVCWHYESNTGLAKSPTETVATQSNHMFMRLSRRSN